MPGLIPLKTKAEAAENEGRDLPAEITGGRAHMSDEPKPNKGELIPSRNRSLARKKSGLVNRGLEPMSGLKKQQIRVQIGNFENPLNDVLSELIKEVIKDKYHLKLGSSSYGEDLLELAENGAIDIFILIMNNIRFSSVDSVGDRLVNSLQLITQIKTTYGRPVIVSSGYSSLIARAKLAADFYLQLPFKVDAFMEAFEKCLEMLPGFDDVPRNRFKGNAGHTTTSPVS
jgi:hypothetical protein